MLLLDANILVRAVLGSRVLFLLQKYSEQGQFLAPDTAFEEARTPAGDSGTACGPNRSSNILDRLAGLVQVVEVETYGPFEDLARQRIARRDEEDWTVLGARTRLPDLDRGHRFLRVRRRNVDHRLG